MFSNNNADRLVSSPLHFSSPSVSPPESNSASLHRASDDDWDHLSDQLRDHHISHEQPVATAESKPSIKFRHVEPREAQPSAPRREPTRRRVPAPDVPNLPPLDRDYRGPRHHTAPRRPSSELSDSVGSHEGYPGFDPRVQHPGDQHWAHVAHQPASYQPSVSTQPYNHYQPVQGIPPQQLVSYGHPDPWGYYGSNPFASPYGYSQAPSVASQSTGYFHDPRGHPQGYPMPVMPYGHAMPYAYPSPPAAPPAEDKKVDRLEEFVLKQEHARLAREEAREKKMEADKLAAEARAAKEAEDRKAAEALASAAKTAKEKAETKAAEREAEYEKAHKEALDDARKKLEEAKVAEELAKQEAAAHKPSDDSLKGPIKFKDAVGRKFSFPWQVCKTWKGMDYLINQAFLPVPNLGPRVHDGHYDLMGPDGEIILPTVWETTVKPDWQITMTMWPMPSPKPEPVKVEHPKPVEMPPPLLPMSMDHSRHSKSKNRHSRRSDALPPLDYPQGMMPPPPSMMDYPDMMSYGPSLGMKSSSSRRKAASAQVAVVNGRKVMVRPRGY